MMLALLLLLTAVMARTDPRTGMHDKHRVATKEEFRFETFMDGEQGKEVGYITTINCGNGVKCVVLKRGEDLDMGVEKSARQRSLAGLLSADGPGPSGFEYVLPNDPLGWCQHSKQEGFNCHTFAYSWYFNFTPNDWLDNNQTIISALKAKEGFEDISSSPLLDLREAYFPQRVIEAKNLEEVMSTEFWDHISVDQSLKHGDLIQWSQTEDGKEMVVHSGIVYKHPVEVHDEKTGLKTSTMQNWVVSKIGQEPILVLPMHVVASLYAGNEEKPGFDQVHVRRFSHPQERQKRDFREINKRLRPIVPINER